jgi:hypothetical protein
MTQREFLEAWGKQCDEWARIRDELLDSGRPITAFQVSLEQRKRMLARGDRPVSLLDVDDAPLEPGPEEPTTVQVGHKDGRVVLNFFGTSEVKPSYVAWSPDEARAIAEHLLRAADAAER